MSLFVVLTVFTVLSHQSAFSWQLPEKKDYRDHPCIRDCLQSTTPMTCEYNFTLEYYQTLSHACYDCPNNTNDCERPHCVIGDGIRRTVKVVNRQMPGPAIHVCAGDTLVVYVYNELDDLEGSSIHWHGILQYDTPYMDGTSMITQCPITAKSMFQYKFQVPFSGTHYWHAHAGHQRADGINGALVVRDTRQTNNMELYDHDIPEHTIILQDWLEDLASSIYTLHHHGVDEDLPRSVLLNGRGSLFNTGNEGLSNDPTTMYPTVMPIPYEVFRVQQGMRYRFRIISNGVANCPLKFSVEQHNVTLIASDGYDMHPIEVDSFYLFGGERYDLVLNANHTVGNYWIYVVVDCEGELLSQTAILRYEGAENENPSTGNSYNAGNRQGLVANPVEYSPDTWLVANMTSDYATEQITINQTIKKFYLDMEFNNVETDMFLHPEYYPLSLFIDATSDDNENHLFALQVNRISHVIPWTPVLTQYGHIPEDEFCNETSTTINCSNNLCRCIHRIKLDLDDVVEFVLISGGVGGLGNHPMHLHGLNFHVLGMGKLNATTTRQEIEEMDRNGQLRRNLIDPVKKDTVMVPDGGYTIIRFRADNPGFWLFHCHVDFHLSLRLALILQVGEPGQMPKTPPNFPKCGHFSYMESDGNPTEQPDQCTSSSGFDIASSLFLIWIACLVCFNL